VSPLQTRRSTPRSSFRAAKVTEQRTGTQPPEFDAIVADGVDAFLRAYR
jgi:hypothetical protein